ncbi:hypothetical protein [Gemmatimonas groenlandica]|nr:hypothetical protein [Gemmatimonas groenlandica]
MLRPPRLRRVGKGHRVAFLDGFFTNFYNTDTGSAPADFVPFSK